MAEEPKFTNTHAQCRAKAVQLAADLAGLPDDYQQSYTWKGKPQQAKGIRGAFGMTDEDGASSATGNTYPDAVIALADYIVTGRREVEDEK